MKLLMPALVVAILFGAGSSLRADIEAEMAEASQALQPVMHDAQPLLAEGRVDEANQKILATFPEKSRTSVQALVLGNVLFRHDPRLSYALHKRATVELPNEPVAQLEWAMEQHRAGEYGGAARSYAKFIDANPQFGPALGLLSECLIRTGQTRQAVEAWVRSEQGGGSLEQLESWVCEVHTHTTPDRDRAVLLAKVKTANADAAARLVALDCNFEGDWWNRAPQAEYLAKDLEVLRKTKFADESMLRETECAARCGLIQAKGEGDVGTVLRKYGFLLDDRGTLPRSTCLVAPMLAAALSGDAISASDARRKLGPAILEKAKASRDVEVFNAAAHLYLRTGQLAEIDQAGWDATGDPRFAASLLVGLAAKGTLTLDDPRLVKAVKQFPENAEIARIVVSLSAKAGKPMQDVLVNAIRAEFSHFSIAGDLFGGRPGAAALRGYFSQLSKELNVQVAPGGEPSFQRRGQYLAGNELRVVMETSRQYRPPFSHGAKTADAKGWLITIDLSKQGELTGRSRVYGPLWDVPDPRSSISFEAGANFTKEDSDAAAAAPFVAFDSDGTLVRIRRDAKGGMIREHLLTGNEAASWQYDSPYAPIASYLTWPSEDQVDTFSRKYHVQGPAGKVTVHEFLTAKRVGDVWLQAAFGQYQSIEHFKNVQLWLTEDLKFLVCSPAEIWNTGEGTTYDTFQLGGKTYKRSEYGLIWSRPTKEPAVFKKEEGRGIALANGPGAAFSLDGHLYLFYDQPMHLRLVPVGGGPTYEATPPNDAAWRWVPAQQIQHVEKAHQMVFFADGFMADRLRRPDETIVVFVWDYRAGTITPFAVHTAELFQRRDNVYVPRNGIALR